MVLLSHHELHLVMHLAILQVHWQDLLCHSQPGLSATTWLASNPTPPMPIIVKAIPASPHKVLKAMGMFRRDVVI